MIKVLYKPTGMLVSVLGGVLAGAIFKQVWKVAFSEDDAPKATDADRSWREVLLAAAVQGAIFGLVKAAVDRGAAEGTRKVTGVWPGDEASRKAWPATGRNRDARARTDAIGFERRPWPPLLSPQPGASPR